jgi:hypothetical protein
MIENSTNSAANAAANSDAQGFAAANPTSDASYVFNVLILDESGSMGSIASAAKEVFEGYLHRLIQEQQDIPDLTQYINMWTFGKPYVNENIPLVKIHSWDKVFPEYCPSGNTPMFDAIGMSIHKLKESLRILDLQKEQYQVKVFIVSDGEENASREYKASQIGALIRGLIAEGWAFDYYGTDHDITSMADTLNIESNRRVMFQKTKAGMESARDQYMAEIMKEKMSFMESRRSDSSKK